MRLPTELEKLKWLRGARNPYLPEEIYGTTAHEKLEKFTGEGQTFMLPGYIASAVDAVNMINSSGHVQVRTSRQYGISLLLKTVDEMMNPPVPAPKPRNWYREFIFGPMTVREPWSNGADPLGDLVAMSQFFTRVPSPSELEAQHVLRDAIQADVRRRLIQDGARRALFGDC